MIEERIYSSDVIIKHLNKEVVITKEDNKGFKNSTKCCICGNDYIDNDFEVRDHCHITGKYNGSVHGDHNMNLKLDYKIPMVFHNLKKYDSHLIMQRTRQIQS